MYNNMNLKRQQGFTLVEIAIALVIIGVLLGGVMKGQELVDTAKSRATLDMMSEVGNATNSYFERYRAYPGDDGPVAALVARGGNWVSITATGDQNGNIDSLANIFTAGANENTYFFRDLRMAGFMTGDANSNTLAGNKFSGLTGVATGSAYGMPTAMVVCTQNVPGKLAADIDRRADDGNANGGTIRSQIGLVPTPAPTSAALTVATYDESGIYTMCKQLM